MIDLGLAGRRVLVTGGTSGIGLAVARAFLAEDADVAVLGRSAERAAAAARALRAEFPGRRALGLVADVADPDALRAAVAEVVEDLGGLDHLVCSAGTSGETGASVAEAGVEAFVEVQRVNVGGPFAAVQAALEALRAGQDPTVTFVGSDSGFVAAPGMIAYGASKGALVQLTRVLSVELHAPHGIRVNSVCPSIVDTPMSRGDLGIETWEGVGYPVSRPEDVAWLVLSLASPRSLAVTGVSLLADFGYHARSSFPA